MKSNQLTFKYILDYCGCVGQNSLRITYLETQVGNNLPHVFFLLNLPFLGRLLFRIFEPLFCKYDPRVEDVLHVAVSISHNDRGSMSKFYRLQQTGKLFVFSEYIFICFVVVFELIPLLICFFVKHNGKKD